MKLLVAVILIGLISASSAYDFYVGGRDGWTQSPSESYSHWAQRMRFQVHDKLVFKYKKGADSVLVVKKEDYDSCSTSNPAKKMEDGDSVFVIDRSGPFYFISGSDGNCAKGQKLVIVVLAERNKKPVPTPTPTPTPSPSSPPAPSPSAPSPSPSTEPPTSPSPSPLIESPSPSPTPSTESPTPPTSPSPSAPSPYSPTTPPPLPSPSVPSPNLPSLGAPPSSDQAPPGNKKSSASVATAASSLSLGALLVLVCAVVT
ncbi:putative early nodulin-like protein 1 [Iris pallida]|uniref:Early nodulin-like protein 1 n=1 Tax=Iris pallida TaxID=29817 RepID=A0AAX6EB66_IRIPA|nr:putative early nodulin-like protein 1 [Iris pallida]